MADIIAHDLSKVTAELDDYILGIDTSNQSEAVQMSFLSVAKKIVESYTNTKINGTNQSITSAFQSLKNLIDSRTMYNPGDTISGNLWVSGVITNSKSDVYFPIPLSKPIKSGANISVSTLNIVLRQNGSYHFGNESSTANAILY